MHGFVSLLDNIHYSIVEDLWKELEEQFGLTGIKVTPYPHFSWQVAEEYNLDKIENLMQNLSKKLKPFKIKTTGLGIFAGENIILYITVTINRELLTYHEKIFNHFKGITHGIVQYYTPNNWVPHISLAYTDLTQDNIGEVVKYLSLKNYHWDIKINNIAFIYEPTGSIGELLYQVKL